MQYAVATAGVLKPLGMGFQRAGQAYRGPENSRKQLIFSKACSVVLMGPEQAGLESGARTWGFHWVVLELEPLFLFEI